ncbi:hypothetical protein TNCV_3750941 [Trichonephila clavipes]|uniref:Uncharacterized protein n=1 Tax=Trichonephila clavipes TaxID=2585209 RepID=A0A8X6UP63_TRICX|nr:hypothetical protein TNCV_3750941 [Trichonephila clavipes]
MSLDRHVPDRDPRNSSGLDCTPVFSCSLDYQAGERTIWLVFHSNFEREQPEGYHWPPTSLPLPPTLRDDLRLNGYLEYPHSPKGTIHS